MFLFFVFSCFFVVLELVHVFSVFVCVCIVVLLWWSGCGGAGVEASV